MTKGLEVRSRGTFETILRALQFLHVFLLAIYPGVALYFGNSDFIRQSELADFLVAACLVSLATILGASLLARSLERGALYASTVFVATFLYEYPALVVKSIADILRVSAELANWGLFALWVCILIKVLRTQSRWSVGRFRSLNIAVTTFSVLWLALSFFTPLISWIENSPEGGAKAELPNDEAAAKSALPNIYYVILDGYGRADILSEFFGHNNEPFLSELKKRGFFVAADSHSNYAQTLLSLSSSLNHNYLNALLPAELSPLSENRGLLINLIKQSTVLSDLESRGYEFLNYASGYQPTDFRGAERYINAAPRSALLEGLFFNVRFPYLNTLISHSFFASHRARMLSAFSTMGSEPVIDRPRFVFSHIVSPHPPFVFDENGKAREPDGPYSLADGVLVKPDPHYTEKYRDQVLFVNRELLAITDRILSRTDRPSVIIFQGDHGPGSKLKWNTMSADAYRERFSIFNVYYFPDRDYADLYPSISPVNSFRVIGRKYFQADLPNLSDESFFSTWDQPFDLKKVSP